MLDYHIEGKRILEIGCGIALTSLVLNHRLADITATDYHPEAHPFLIANVALNNGKQIPFVRRGWEDDEDGLGTFDLIIGSDLLYESDHSQILSEFINLSTNSDNLFEDISLKKIKKLACNKIEKEVISYVLSKVAWNRSKASKILKISYKTLLYKIKELNINPQI